MRFIRGNYLVIEEEEKVRKSGIPQRVKGAVEGFESWEKGWTQELVGGLT